MELAAGAVESRSERPATVGTTTEAREAGRSRELVVEPCEIGDEVVQVQLCIREVGYVDCLRVNWAPLF